MRISDWSSDVCSSDLAITESFVSARPADPSPTPLPRLVRETPKPHFDVRVPVIAAYAQLQPVVDRALAKRSKRPFVLPELGPMQIDRASWRERVCQYVEIPVGGV